MQDEIRNIIKAHEQQNLEDEMLKNLEMKTEPEGKLQTSETIIHQDQHNTPYDIVTTSGDVSVQNTQQNVEIKMQDTTTPILLRIVTIEKDINVLKNQIVDSISFKESNIQLSGMREIISRMEKEVVEAKGQLADLITRQLEQGAEERRKLEIQHARQATVQIKLLWGIVYLLIGVLITLLVAYLIHLYI